MFQSDCKARYSSRKVRLILKLYRLSHTATSILFLAESGIFVDAMRNLFELREPAPARTVPKQRRNSTGQASHERWVVEFLSAKVKKNETLG